MWGGTTSDVASRGSGSLPMADGRWPPTLSIFLTFTYSRDAPHPSLRPPCTSPHHLFNAEHLNLSTASKLNLHGVVEYSMSMHLKVGMIRFGPQFALGFI